MFDYVTEWSSSFDVGLWCAESLWQFRSLIKNIPQLNKVPKFLTTGIMHIYLTVRNIYNNNDY